MLNFVAFANEIKIAECPWPLALGQGDGNDRGHDHGLWPRAGLEWSGVVVVLEGGGGAHRSVAEFIVYLRAGRCEVID